LGTAAIDATRFRTAHGEIFLTFAKCNPFLEELRAAAGSRNFAGTSEQVVLAAPDPEGDHDTAASGGRQQHERGGNPPPNRS
jgi:hypothetical protein